MQKEPALCSCVCAPAVTFPLPEHVNSAKRKPGILRSRNPGVAPRAPGPALTALGALNIGRWVSNRGRMLQIERQEKLRGLPGDDVFQGDAGIQDAVRIHLFHYSPPDGNDGMIS